MRPLIGLTAAAVAIIAARAGSLALDRRQRSWCRERHFRLVPVRVAGPRSGAALRVNVLRAERQADDTPPLVLVHGWGIGSSYWLPVAARLSARDDVSIPELPGHGESEHDAAPLTVSEHAAVLEGVLRAGAAAPAVLVGHSVGCQIVAEVAARAPERVAGLVLIGPTGDPAARRVVQIAARATLTAPRERLSLGLWAARDYARAGLRVLGAETNEMRRHATEAVLRRVSTPALVMRGARDRIAPQPWTATVPRLLQAPPPVVIPGAAHAVHYSHPERVSELIHGFLRRLGESRA